ncbi:unnamed protein product [Polarella glacialis]|uniref:EF-hand domain-containing protein n=1 Tax=Polarella glacialis TaxID=89957 RepID=A0A813G0M1_POLGL|nr:unnamed protein product [Polarella glacialis]
MVCHAAAAAVVVIRRKRRPAQCSRARWQPVSDAQRARAAAKRERARSLTAGKREEAERARASVERREKERLREVKGILARYDRDGSKFLERAELLELLTDLDSSTPVGTTPSDEEVDFVMKVADVSGDGKINIRELDVAIVCFTTFIEQREVFEAKLKMYDVSRTGSLNRDEVQAYLTDLSGGEVTEQELDMIIKGSDVNGDGVINKMELKRATSLWYGYIEEKQAKKSAICILL